MKTLCDILESLDSPLLLKGNVHTAYRDPAAFYLDGVIHLFFTLVETEPSGDIFMYVAQTQTSDFWNFTPVVKLTKRDKRCNYSSPGCIIRFGVNSLCPTCLIHLH